MLEIKKNDNTKILNLDLVLMDLALSICPH